MLYIFVKCVEYIQRYNLKTNKKMLKVSQNILLFIFDKQFTELWTETTLTIDLLDGFL